MEKKNTSNFELLNNLTYIYLIIPIIIFLLGWVKLWISIPLSLALIIFAYKKLKKMKINLKKYLIENKKEIIIILFISLILIFLSGIGGFVYQNKDHLYRNAIFSELINNKWPIYISPGGEFTKEVMMVYYFAIWLPSALIGKIFGMKIAYLSFYIWCVIGLFLFLNYLRKYNKNNYLIPIILFIGISGLDIIEQLFCNQNFFDLITSFNHLERTTGYQYSSFITQLFWVFNQAIPAWLLTMLILNEKDNNRIFILVTISLLFSTFPTVGLLFIAFYKIYLSDNNKLNIDNIIEKTKALFTKENLLLGIPLFLIIVSFILSNSAGSIITTYVTSNKILSLVITYMFEFFIYYYFIFKYTDNKRLAIISFISLLICPFISINGSDDFCMRASIPGLVVMLILIIKLFPKIKNNKIDYIIFLIIFMIGAITPLNEINRTILNTPKNKQVKYINLITSNYQENFYGYKDESLFVKYFAKDVR